MNLQNYYVPENPVYLTGMMGVAIASTALAFLTFAWSVFCILIPRMGFHPRSCDLLLALSILTGTFVDLLSFFVCIIYVLPCLQDCSIITTIGMFLGKDNKLYPFENYGISFWLSVSAASGFLLISVVFAVNRINSGIIYKNKYYDTDLDEP
jgi:hypothetical protein